MLLRTSATLVPLVVYNCLSVALEGRNVGGLKYAVTLFFTPPLESREIVTGGGELLEEAQGVLILKADAVVHATGRRLTESAVSCANSWHGAVSQVPI